MSDESRNQDIVVGVLTGREGEVGGYKMSGELVGMDE